MISAELVVVGASYAGVGIALAARDAGFDGRILLLGAEPHAPYHRPPLSKRFLTGAQSLTDLALHTDEGLRRADIQFWSGVEAHALDRDRHEVLTSAGPIGYSRLALATGARPRRLRVPGADHDQVHYLRSLDDAAALRDAAPQATAVVVIGGGFIGLEVAAAFSGLGKQVTVIESAPRVLARGASARLAAIVTDRHRRAGVDVRLNTGITEILTAGGRVTGVLCADGSTVSADLVVVGIGVDPNTELAAAANLACDDGILVDEYCRTSDPAIVAAGDCCRFPSGRASAPLRLESVPHASAQAEIAGGVIAGVFTAYDALPWFWSDQYNVKIQIAGILGAADRTVPRGDPESGKFSMFFFRGDRLECVESLNRPADHMQARRLLISDRHPTPDEIADPDFDLAGFVRATGQPTGAR